MDDDPSRTVREPQGQDEARPRLGDMTLADLARYSGLSKNEILRRLIALQAGEPLIPSEDEIWRAIEAEDEK